MADDRIPGWVLDELDTVPAYDHFAGVDELHAGLRSIAERFPEVATLRRCGTSRQGDPMWCLTVELRDSPEALVYGLPHPNEPIGGLTALHLAERLCTDAALRERLGHRWRIVDCADPDGLRLNEGWLRGPFTRAHYGRHFYRPAGRDQVEWTFPINHETAYFDEAMPETLALMRLIDEHRPRLVASLHNSELGGAYYWLSRAEPALHPVLQALPGHLGIPLDRGEPEAPDLVVLGDAIFEASSLADVYERRTADGGEWVDQGGSATWYAGRFGALMLVSELPYWLDPTAGDASDSGRTYAQALAEEAAGLHDLAALLTRTLAAVEGRLLAPESPYWRSARFFAHFVAEVAKAQQARSESPAADRPASVAEVTSLASHVHEWRLRYGGVLLRALRGEAAVGNVRPEVRAALAELSAAYDAWVAADDHNDGLEPIEIRRLVSVQYAATIAAAAHLTGTLA
ncbi:M14 family zinc carboxypeptidase [Actinoplanes sp. RD1]|uniref:M14 family zinc carboxypeptidase n=1 Tax=Actinoplanes sp. RD1 TaxID=3064538 RepID=UPI0027407280|nr:M14 family zinc carboxypeptidase [Actinoplanes sp. RD1]